jgi:hypothetical protein
MHDSVDYFIHVQDPILGIKSANLADKLDHHNWQRKAITRRHDNGSHYIYLCRATTGRKRYYCVNTYDLAQGKTLRRQLFECRDEALQVANSRLP